MSKIRTFFRVNFIARVEQRHVKTMYTLSGIAVFLLFLPLALAMYGFFSGILLHTWFLWTLMSALAITALASFSVEWLIKPPRDESRPIIETKSLLPDKNASIIVPPVAIGGSITMWPNAWARKLEDSN
ncbi:MAG: hypothetical protein H6797_03960 [Candidatus Nomurabacteria bacterium]|nr:MAG: hypothetical protein H6797_03960 [Candidatus Nomurabacteria bacterium]